MNHRLFRFRHFDLFFSAAFFAAVTGLCALAATSENLTVSQKGRQFRPGEVTIDRGQTIVIFNDDGDLLHHAYVESDDFSFDSGDQQPGSRTPVVFSVPGDFKVLCGIHPKMKLTVHVR